MKKLKVLLFVLLLALSIFALAGCADNTEGAATADPNADNSLQQVLDNGVLRVGMCPEYPPFESIDAENAIVGFDPSLAAAIAEVMGVEVECVNIPWEGLIAGVNNGEFDLIMSAMSPEEATAATDAVELSENYFTLTDVVVVRSDYNEITSKEDLAGKIVGVQDACSAAQAAEALPDQGIVVATLNHYTRNAEAFAELANGRIDAIIVGKAYAEEQAKSNSGFQVLDIPLNEIGIAAVAKDGSVALIEKFNEIVNQLKEDGTYDQIVVQWLAAD